MKQSATGGKTVATKCWAALGRMASNTCMHAGNGKTARVFLAAVVSASFPYTLPLMTMADITAVLADANAKNAATVLGRALAKI